jgi:ATP-binding cassette subfamily A (ABC1) protein 2
LGEGYHLVLVKNEDNNTLNEEEVPSMEIQKFIREYTPTAKYMFESKQEIHFILPNIELKNFVKLFSALENSANLAKLKVSNFGLKNSTLEEIFLKVASNWKFSVIANSCNFNRNSSLDRATTSSATTSYDQEFNVVKEHIRMPTEKVESKKRLLFNQFSAIIFKRWCCTKRNWKGLFSQILLPAFFVCVAMSVALIAPKSQDMPPLVLSPAQYYNYTQHLGGNVVPFCERQFNESFNISSTFHLPSGVGSTCLLKSSDMIADNYTELSDYDLVTNYLKLDSRCSSVLVPGIKPRIFLPVPPTSSSISEDNLSKMTANVTKNITNSYDYKYNPYCSCSSDGTGHICDSSGFQYPPSLKLITGDVLIDISGIDSGRKEHEYYLYTTDMYRLRRYGAFTFGLIRNYTPEDFAQNINDQQSRILRQIAVRNATRIWFNNKGFHSMPTYLNVLNNAILRANLPKSKGNPAAFGITLINHPMTDTSYVISQEQLLQGTDVLMAIFIIVAMSFVPASFVLFLVYERFTKAKHLQFVSGVNVIVYWTANYFWDMV